MDKLILPKTKILLSAANPLKNIVSPLYKIVKISLFSYVRSYYDNTFMDLCDREQAIESIYYDNKPSYMDVPPDVCPELIANEYFLMLCDDFENPSMRYLCQQLKIKYFFILTKKYKYFYEIFWFGGYQTSQFIHFCINHVDRFQSFIRYFKNNYDTKKLIQRCEQDKMWRFISDDAKSKCSAFINHYKQCDYEESLENDVCKRIYYDQKK